MAKIRIRNTGEVIDEQEQVTTFLNQFEVLYEHWDTAKMPEELQGNCKLDDAQKSLTLKVFEKDIKKLAERRGYVSWDVVALHQGTPGLDELLKKFEQVHIHTEDEVRAITAGHGIFIIKGDSETGYFNVELEPGDVISVPENYPHFFTLQEDREVVAIRLFVDPSGWVAHPYEDPEFKG